MFLTIGLVGLAVLALGCGVFLGFAPDHAEPGTRPQPRPALEPSEAPAASLAAGSAPLYVDPATLEAVLSLLEKHVRQEQAAVEDFSQRPSERHLRSQTMSPLVH